MWPRSAWARRSDGPDSRRVARARRLLWVTGRRPRFGSRAVGVGPSVSVMAATRRHDRSRATIPPSPGRPPALGGGRDRPIMHIELHPGRALSLIRSPVHRWGVGRAVVVL